MPCQRHECVAVRCLCVLFGSADAGFSASECEAKALCEARLVVSCADCSEPVNIVGAHSFREVSSEVCTRSKAF